MLQVDFEFENDSTVQGNLALRYMDILVEFDKQGLLTLRLPPLCADQPLAGLDTAPMPLRVPNKGGGGVQAAVLRKSHR